MNPFGSGRTASHRSPWRRTPAAMSFASGDDAQTQPGTILQKTPAALDRCSDVPVPYLVGQEKVRLPHPTDAWTEVRLGTLPLRSQLHPRTVEIEGPTLSIRQQDGLRVCVLDDRVQEPEVFGALIPEQQRCRRGHCGELLRRLEHRLADGLDDRGLLAQHRLVHRPLEAVSPHALVPVEPGELSELTERDVDTVAVVVFQIFLSQVVELRPADRPGDGVHRPTTFVDGLLLREKRDVPRSGGHRAWLPNQFAHVSQSKQRYAPRPFNWYRLSSGHRCPVPVTRHRARARVPVRAARYRCPVRPVPLRRTGTARSYRYRSVVPVPLGRTGTARSYRYAPGTGECRGSFGWPGVQVPHPAGAEHPVTHGDGGWIAGGGHGRDPLGAPPGPAATTEPAAASAAREARSGRSLRPGDCRTGDVPAQHPETAPGTRRRATIVGPAFLTADAPRDSAVVCRSSVLSEPGRRGGRHGLCR